MTRVGALLLLFCALLLGAPASAQQRMQVSLVPETTSVLPGTTLTLAFVMRPGAGWHGYWRNPGDAGAEPRVRWRLPEGWTAEPLQYPAPDRLIVMGLMNYVFERDYALLATIRVPSDAEPGVASPIDRWRSTSAGPSRWEASVTSASTISRSVGKSSNPTVPCCASEQCAKSVAVAQSPLCSAMRAARSGLQP